MKMELIELLQNLIYVILIAVIPVLTTFLVQLIARGKEMMNAYIEKIDMQSELVEADRLKYYIERASEMIEDIVVTVNQTFSNDLKEQGKFDAEAQLEAFSKAYNTAMMMMSEDMKEAVTEIYTDIDSWVGCKIESFVNKNKQPLLKVEEIEESVEEVETETDEKE